MHLLSLTEMIDELQAESKSCLHKNSVAISMHLGCHKILPLLHCRHVHYRRLDIDDMVIIITRKLGRYETLFFHTPLPLSTTLVSTISTLLVSMQKCQHKLLAHRQMVKCDML